MRTTRDWALEVLRDVMARREHMSDSDSRDMSSLAQVLQWMLQREDDELELSAHSPHKGEK